VNDHDDLDPSYPDTDYLDGNVVRALMFVGFAYAGLAAAAYAVSAVVAPIVRLLWRAVAP
jgi:hypothetical protein